MEVEIVDLPEGAVDTVVVSEFENSPEIAGAQADRLTARMITKTEIKNLTV
jgi:hypothetical protein